MAVVYVLKSIEFDRRYIGSTKNNDVNVRLKNHNQGKVRSTKAYKPWIVVYTEQFENYTEARKREIYLKTGVGRKELNSKILK